ncbi:MAG TPA: ABC transporter substrate-binding protein [Candidatus Dormibacteraeota bacterium]|nr:ABC transporter substrate-binding protein [Candidatus Dormibacteraeota bacterium]
MTSGNVRPSSVRYRLMARLCVGAAALLLVASCQQSGSSSPPAPAADACARTAASTGDCGGMDRLVAMARSEGTLNVIGLPRAWANYGALLDGFQAKYGIKITSLNPNGDSLDEIAAVTSAGKTANAPDVLDLRIQVAASNATMFTPYKVSTWNDIPDGQKDSNGQWFEDYGGYMSVGYDSSRVPAIASIDDFAAAKFRYKVGLDGDPIQADSALGAVMMASLAEGGTLPDISRGVAYFHQLKLKGHWFNLQATSKTIQNGSTPVVFDWDYVALANGKNLPSWKVYVPNAAVVGGFYAQAINKNAPHPAAARLWEEYLYSDAGQNLWLQGLVRPVRLPVMETAGTVDQFADSALPAITGVPVFMTPDAIAAARTYLSSHWTAAIS